MKHVVGRCVKEHLDAVFDNVVIYSSCSDVIEIGIIHEWAAVKYGSQVYRCHFGFYDTYVKVGMTTLNTYNYVAEVYYSDPDMLNILKRWVCGILGLERVV